MNDFDSDSDSFGAGVLVLFLGACIFTFGFIIGGAFGESVGQKETAILTVNGLNRIKEQLPPGTKIANPFGDEDLKSLGYDAQKILRLFN
jgi:hypothetical protein